MGSGPGAGDCILQSPVSLGIWGDVKIFDDADRHALGLALRTFLYFSGL